MRFLLIASLAQSLINFRGPLIAALQDAGLEVHVAAPGLASDSMVRRTLEARGVVAHDVALRRTGTNPLSDLKALWMLWRLMRRIRPQYMMGYTIKPVIYGNLAALLAGVPHRFALITGLGYAFQGDGQRQNVQTLAQHLYTIALSKAKKVFFQNPDDELLFRQLGILKGGTPSCVVNGSGVCLDQFQLAPLRAGPVRFLLIARLLGDKGIREYAHAAGRLRAQYPDVVFTLVGPVDENPNAIQLPEVAQWVAQGAIDYLGEIADVRSALANCSVYVLPSYREGTPRTVLEAMATGRAVITTDAPGCRETVIDGDNGFLVAPKSAGDLEAAMRKFIDAPALVSTMGARSRRIAEERYDVRKVNACMLREMDIGAHAG